MVRVACQRKHHYPQVILASLDYDGTSRPVAEELMADGIPREDSFHPADLRQLTGFGC